MSKLLGITAPYAYMCEDSIGHKILNIELHYPKPKKDMLSWHTHADCVPHDPEGYLLLWLFTLPTRGLVYHIFCKRMGVCTTLVAMATAIWGQRIAWLYQCQAMNYCSLGLLLSDLWKHCLIQPENKEGKIAWDFTEDQKDVLRKPEVNKSK